MHQGDTKRGLQITRTQIPKRRRRRRKRHKTLSWFLPQFGSSLVPLPLTRDFLL